MGKPDIYVTTFVEQTRRTETSQYPEEKKSNEIPLVVASESGTALKLCIVQQNVMERTATVGDSPVYEKLYKVKSSRSEHVKF